MCQSDGGSIFDNLMQEWYLLSCAWNLVPEYCTAVPTDYNANDQDSLSQVLIPTLVTLLMIIISVLLFVIVKI